MKPTTTAAPSERTRVRRRAERGVYERDVIHAILDEGYVAHVGIAAGEQPFVLPMAYARDGDLVYLHGSPSNRLLRALRDGAPACLTVTLIDALVLARSAAHHSINFRSVVVLGRAHEVTEQAAKDHAFERIVEHVLPGRWSEARPPSHEEFLGTLVLALPLDEASAKIRTGPPVDDEADLDYPVWAGLLPLERSWGSPVTSDGVGHEHGAHTTTRRPAH